MSTQPNRPPNRGNPKEQFYLVWPCLLLVLLKLFPSDRAAHCTLAMALAVVVGRAFETWAGAAPEWIYNSFQLRSDGLLLGSALALYIYRNDDRSAFFATISKYTLYVTGPVFILMFFLSRYDDKFMLYIGYAMSNITASNIISVLARRSEAAPAAGRPIAPPLVYVGTISYGLYLWHYPLLIQLSAQYQFGKLAWTVTACAMSLALASLSFFVIERPVLALRNIRAGDALGRAAFVVTLGSLAAGLWLFLRADILQGLRP